MILVATTSRAIEESRTTVTKKSRRAKLLVPSRISPGHNISLDIKYFVDEKFNKNCFIVFARKLLISWAENPDYWKWTKEKDVRFVTNRAVWRLGLATGMSREFELQTNYLAKLEVLSCSAPASVTLQLPYMLHTCASFGDSPVARLCLSAHS
uniref:Uncharacterized protein n=1 Tax=Quercus lobata TaxID=97700 RepID=A0A7N2MWD7_QUELO